MSERTMASRELLLSGELRELYQGVEPLATPSALRIRVAHTVAAAEHHPGGGRFRLPDLLGQLAGLAAAAAIALILLAAASMHGLIAPLPPISIGDQPVPPFVDPEGGAREYFEPMMALSLPAYVAFLIGVGLVGAFLAWGIARRPRVRRLVAAACTTAGDRLPMPGLRAGLRSAGPSLAIALTAGTAGGVAVTAAMVGNGPTSPWEYAVVWLTMLMPAAVVVRYPGAWRREPVLLAATSLAALTAIAEHLLQPFWSSLFNGYAQLLVSPLWPVVLVVAVSRLARGLATPSPVFLAAVVGVAAAEWSRSGIGVSVYDVEAGAMTLVAGMATWFGILGAVSVAIRALRLTRSPAWAIFAIWGLGLLVQPVSSVLYFSAQHYTGAWPLPADTFQALLTWDWVVANVALFAAIALGLPAVPRPPTVDNEVEAPAGPLAAEPSVQG